MLHRNTLPLPAAHGVAPAPGVSMAIAVRDLLHSKPSLHDLASQVRQHVAQGTPVTLTLFDLGPRDESVQALDAFCHQLGDAGVPSDNLISTCLNSATTPLRAYAMLTRCWFGDGPRFVIPDALQMQHPTAENGGNALWKYLWRHRETRWAILPAYGGSVSTPCPLLADENANAVLPTGALHAPSGTAWLPLRLHLPRFADDNGVVDLQRLTEALQACVTHGERILDQQKWPTPCMQSDARINRRMAISVSGIGDLVQARGVNPSDLEVLQSLARLMEHIRTTAWNCSAELARGKALLPAIARHKPAQAVSDGEHNADWATRWEAAVERCAVRHRNLLVMSPYAVLPTAGDGCAAYTDLLPLIGCADAHSFAPPAPLQRWNFREFCRFHRRAWAVMQRRNGVSLVATRA